MTTTSPGDRYETLDMWRGLACLAVVIHHAATYGEFVYDTPELTRPVVNGMLDSIVFHLPLLGYGVTLFFVISGYCIAASATSTLRNRRSPREFFKRRLRRIFPPYLAALLLLLAAMSAASALGIGSIFTHSMGGGTGLPPPGRLSSFQWLGNVTLTEGFRGHLPHLWRGGGLQWFLGPAWSLGYEEQFYALCGLLVLLLPRHFYRGAILISGAAAVGLWVSVSRPDFFVGTFLDGRWLLFAVGVLVHHTVTVRPRRIFSAAAFLFLSAWGSYLWLPRVGSELLVACIFGSLLLVLRRWDRDIAQFRLSRPLMRCGTMSFSLYLLHWPVVKALSHVLYVSGFQKSWHVLALSIPGGIAASVIVAWPFFRFVESRFLNHASRGLPDARPQQIPQGAPASGARP